MSISINRTTNKVNSTTYNVFSIESPVNYKKDDGTYEPIDLTFNDATSTIGNISLNRKNVFSTGIRKDKNPIKFTGIRPDNSQDGSKQIELSINNVKINGINGYDIDNFEVKPSPSMFLKLYKNSGFKDFEIEFKIDLKGVSIENDKYAETTKIRNSLKTEFINIGQETGANILNRYISDTDITYSDSYIRLYYGQVTDEFIAKFGVENSDEFGSADLSNYNFYNMEGDGSGTYLKDSIVFYLAGKDIDDFENSVLINFCNKYGLSLEGNDSEDTGKYFFKDSKKVGGYLLNKGKVLGYINTKAIPNDVKSIFIKKDFNETSYLDLTLSQFDSDIKEQFNYDVDSIEVDSNFYSGDSFRIKISKNSYYIMPPLIMDENYSPISGMDDTAHTLKDNGDGSYTYTKYLSIKGLLKNIGNISNFIDVNIISTVLDHVSEYYFSASSLGNSHTSGNLITMRNATTANRGFIPIGQQRLLIHNKLSQTAGTAASSNEFALRMTNMKFDTSAITAATDVKFKHYSYYYNDISGLGATAGTLSGISYILLKSTKVQDAAGTGGFDVTYAKNSWNDMTGHTNFWDYVQTTEYSAGLTRTNSGPGAIAWREDTMTADAVSDVNSLSDFCMQIIDNNEYFDESFDSSWTHGGGTGTKKAHKGFTVDTGFGVTPPNDAYHLVVTESTPAAEDNTPLIGTTF